MPPCVRVMFGTWRVCPEESVRIFSIQFCSQRSPQMRAYPRQLFFCSLNHKLGTVMAVNNGGKNDSKSLFKIKKKYMGVICGKNLTTNC